jgi:hypothetical protein
MRSYYEKITIELIKSVGHRLRLDSAVEKSSKMCETARKTSNSHTKHHKMHRHHVLLEIPKDTVHEALRAELE